MKLTNHSISTLLRAVQSKFSLPEEIEFWNVVIKSGLSKSEKSIVDRHFDKPGLILDVGCGAGREALALIERRHNVVAIDITPEMVKNAQKNLDRHANFVVGDVIRLPFKDDLFDFAVMFEQMLGHIPKRKNRINALKQIKSSLKPKGILILSVFNGKSKDLNCIFAIWKIQHNFLKSKFRKKNKQNGNITGTEDHRFLKNNSKRCYYLALRLIKFIRRIIRTKIYQLEILILNLKRRVLMSVQGSRYVGLELGDVSEKHVSPVKTEQLVFYHRYNYNEFLEDIKLSGFKIVDLKSITELEENISLPRIVKRSDFLFFIALKKI